MYINLQRKEEEEIKIEIIISSREKIQLIRLMNSKKAEYEIWSMCCVQNIKKREEHII